MLFLNKCDCITVKNKCLVCFSSLKVSQLQCTLAFFAFYFSNVGLTNGQYAFSIYALHRVDMGFRAADEIGIPVCVTIDHQSLEDNTVTIRSRDTGEQTRVKASEL